MNSLGADIFFWKGGKFYLLNIIWGRSVECPSEEEICGGIGLHLAVDRERLSSVGEVSQVQALSTLGWVWNTENYDNSLQTARERSYDGAAFDLQNLEILMI